MEERKSAEFTGKTTEEAIEKGLASLGKSRDEVEITILSEGNRGLLGIGAEDARVAIRVLSEAPAPSEPTSESAPAEDAGDLPIDTAKEALEQMLRLMDIACHVEVRTDVSMPGTDRVPFVLDIQSDDDLGILIGRRGETLTALQYLTRLMVGHKTGKWYEFVVDVQNYKVRRGEALQKLAQRMADRVIETGRAVTLEAMPPAERRIVHLALRDHPQVTTHSIGEGDSRKVMILPKE